VELTISQLLTPLSNLPYWLAEILWLIPSKRGITPLSGAPSAMFMFHHGTGHGVWLICKKTRESGNTSSKKGLLASTNNARDHNFINCDVFPGVTFWLLGWIVMVWLWLLLLAYLCWVGLLWCSFQREAMPKRNKYQETHQHHQKAIVNIGHDTN
jgi:hypothetical protein